MTENASKGNSLGFMRKTAEIFSSGKTRQFFGLLSANVVGVPISFVTNMLLISYLGSVMYGNYQFVYTVFNTANILFNFGLFNACNRALVLSKRDNIKNYYGAILVLIIAVSIVLAVVVGIYAVFDPNIAAKGIRKYFLIMIPFSGVFMLNQSFETLLQADNRIRLLAYTRFIPKLLMLVCVLGIVLFVKEHISDKLILILYIYVFSLLAIYLYVYIKLKPCFHDLRRHILSIFSYEKSYGFNVYLGAVCAVGFTQLSDVLISYVSPDNSALGFYRLSIQFSAPLAFIPITLANTNYRDFASSKMVSPRLTKITCSLSVAVMAIIWICVPIMIKLFLKPEVEPVIPIVMVSSVGVLLHGIADFYNRFLGAHGEGKILRNVSFILAPCILVYSLIFIPQFGAMGAAFAKVLGGVTYFGLIYMSYRRRLPFFANKSVI